MPWRSWRDTPPTGFAAVFHNEGQVALSAMSDLPWISPSATRCHRPAGGHRAQKMSYMPRLGPDGGRAGDKDGELASSELFLRLAARLSGDRISVGELTECLAGRGIGILLLIFSLPLCIPNVPGISTLFGLLLLAPAIQLIRGQDALSVPGFARRWAVDGRALRAAFRVGSRVLRPVEILAKPRLAVLTRGPALSLAGLQTLILALVLLLPMPGANVIPGIAIALTGIAILRKDGLFMLMSAAVAAVALAWVYLGGKYIMAFLMWTLALFSGIQS